jgi:predicted transcriptional regulator
MTINEIAQTMNEYTHRITYRKQVLQSLGLIKSKRNTGKMKLIKTKRMLESQLKDVNAELDNLAA